MLDLQTLHALAEAEVVRAAKAQRQPYVFYDAADLARYKSRRRHWPFPSLGSYRPGGWKLVDAIFCDSSGIGEEGEPALTRSQLWRRLEQDLDKGYGYAIIGVGEFQVYVGVFRKKRAKRVRPLPKPRP